MQRIVTAFLIQIQQSIKLYWFLIKLNDVTNRNGFLGLSSGMWISSQSSFDRVKTRMTQTRAFEFACKFDWLLLIEFRPSQDSIGAKVCIDVRMRHLELLVVFVNIVKFDAHAVPICLSQLWHLEPWLAEMQSNKAVRRSGGSCCVCICVPWLTEKQRNKAPRHSRGKCCVCVYWATLK